MKHLYIFITVMLVSLLFAEPLMAQEEVTIRELNTYDAPITSQADLADHPMVGEEVTFDAVVVAYPRNSGLATPDDGESGAEPGRIHLFVTDVNAIEQGRDGMSMQLVVAGAEQRALETYDRGDVIRVTGALSFFGSVGQFNATEVSPLGIIGLDPQYDDLAPLLDPWEIDLSELNQPATEEGLHTWVSENYTKYINSYVKITGLEMIDRLAGQDGNRPWFMMGDGSTILYSSDTSLRYRNDRETYGFLVEEDGGTQDTVLSLDYNYRRKAEDLDGIFNPPAPGSVVDVSGFVILNTFDPTGSDVNSTERTFRIAPWEDGIRWTADGTNTENRITEGIPNDLVVRGSAPLLDQFTITPDSAVTSSDQVSISVDLLPAEEDYTVDGVEIEYSAYPYTADSGETTTEDMTANGSTYSFTFDSFDTFTQVDYTVTGYTTTPEGVQTKATQSGSFMVISETQTAPVTFSPTADATYQNSVEVELSTVTPDASIYYTIDGSDPDESSEEYTGPITLEATNTIKAIAMSDGLEASPINERMYFIELDFISASTLTEIRTGTQGEIYNYTGEAVVTFTQSSRNQKYLMDASGGLLIDDSDGVIVSDYTIGDVMTGLTGELGGFGGISQLVPSSDPGEPTGTASINPPTVTLADINLSEHESMLVTVEDVSFEESGTFEGSTNYNITDPSLEGETMIFRTNFGDVDYIGGDIPSGTFTLTAIVGGYNGTIQLIARSSEDFGTDVSNELDGMVQEFALQQNYPNPFNPTTVIRYSVAEVSNVKLQVFDVLGRRVATLVNNVQSPGSYTVNFDAASLSSGTYFYRIEAGDFTSIKKMMLIK